MAYTFAQLKTAIQEYTDNTETTFVSNLDDFIRAAEDRLFYLVDLEYFRKNATSAMTNGDQFLTLPADFLASFSLSLTNGGSKEFLQQKDVKLRNTLMDQSLGQLLEVFGGQFAVQFWPLAASRSPSAAGHRSPSVGRRPSAAHRRPPPHHHSGRKQKLNAQKVKEMEARQRMEEDEKK